MAHHGRQPHGKFSEWFADRGFRCLLSRDVRAGDWRDEAIASPWKSDHVSRTRLSVRERPAQGGNMKAQAVLVDRDIRPDERHKIPLVHDLPRTFDERDKDVERATTHLDRAAVPVEKPLGYGQSKTSEQDDIVFHLLPHPLWFHGWRIRRWPFL